MKLQSARRIGGCMSSVCCSSVIQCTCTETRPSEPAHLYKRLIVGNLHFAQNPLAGTSRSIGLHVPPDVVTEVCCHLPLRSCVTNPKVLLMLLSRQVRRAIRHAGVRVRLPTCTLQTATSKRSFPYAAGT